MQQAGNSLTQVLESEQLQRVNRPANKQSAAAELQSMHSRLNTKSSDLSNTGGGLRLGEVLYMISKACWLQKLWNCVKDAAYQTYRLDAMHAERKNCRLVKQ